MNARQFKARFPQLDPLSRELQQFDGPLQRLHYNIRGRHLVLCFFDRMIASWMMESARRVSCLEERFWFRAQG